MVSEAAGRSRLVFEKTVSTVLYCTDLRIVLMTDLRASAAPFNASNVRRGFVRKCLPTEAVR